MRLEEGTWGLRKRGVGVAIGGHGQRMWPVVVLPRLWRWSQLVVAGDSGVLLVACDASMLQLLVACDSSMLQLLLGGDSSMLPVQR